MVGKKPPLRFVFLNMQRLAHRVQTDTPAQDSSPSSGDRLCVRNI